jgi:hypothetical protein
VDKLTELERAGHHPDSLAALRSVLAEHQRRRRFPCIVWHQIHIGLFGVFACCDRHRQPQPTSTAHRR